MKNATIFYFFLIFVICLMHPITCFESTNKAISIMYNTLLPSFLFPYIIIRIIAPYRPLQSVLSPFNRLFKLIFNIDSTTFEMFIYALCLGFPSSSAFLNEISLNAYTRKQYHRFTCTIYMCSPSFILISLQTIYKTSITYHLLIIQLLSIIVLLLFTRNIPLTCKLNNENIQLSIIIKRSIKDSFMILMYILAYLVIVYVSIDLLGLYATEIIKLPVKIVSEFSSGSFYIAELYIPLCFKLFLTSILLSYGGLCVHLQIISIMKPIFKYKVFIIYRITQMFIVALLCLFYYFC